MAQLRYISLPPDRRIFTCQTTWPWSSISTSHETVCKGDCCSYTELVLIQNAQCLGEVVVHGSPLLFSIDWNQSERTYLSLFGMLHDVPFYQFYLSSPTSIWHYKYIIAFRIEEGSQERWCSPECVSFSERYRFLLSDKIY